MKLFDTHTHLQDPRLASSLDAVMARARAAGVDRILTCGTCEADWAPLQALVQRYPQILPAYGVHPWFVDTLSPQWLTHLGEYLSKGSSAVGEIGLDFMVAGLCRERQEAVFLAQLRLARDLKRPVSIHCRKAWGRMVELLKGEGGLPQGGAIHSFSGSVEMAMVCQNLGASIAFSGSLTRTHNIKVRKAAASVAPHRLLIETDSPDLLPQNLPGPFNEPAHVIHVVRALADIRHIPVEIMAETTWANAQALFG